MAGTSQAPTAGYAINGRGYPDISVAGASYLVAIGGNFYSLYGTSASCPVFAGMISLINAGRLQAGKSSVGFINQVLYNSYSSFAKDVTSGKNNCAVGSSGASCCAQGFYATSGWDPATGLGSPDYASLKSLFLSTTADTSSPSMSPTVGPSTLRPTSSSKHFIA